MEKKFWFSLIDNITSEIENLSLEHIWYYKGTGTMCTLVWYERKWIFYSEQYSLPVYFHFIFNKDRQTFSYHYSFSNEIDNEASLFKKEAHNELEYVLEKIVSLAKTFILQQKEFRLQQIISEYFKFERMERN